MSEFTMESPRRPEEIERLNDQGAETARAATELLCRETIDIVYSSVVYHLQYDKKTVDDVEERQYPDAEEISLYVIGDNFTAPRRDKEFIDTYSTRVESGNKYMKLHIPSGDAKIEDFELPEAGEVDAVYVEFHDEDTHWYAIQPTGLFEYIPLSKQDDDTTDILSDQGIWQWINDRVPEGLETITTLFRNVVNWNTVHQLTYTIGDTDIET